MDRISIVVMTRDRRDELLRTLARLVELPEQPPIVVADNGSTDGTVAEVRARFPSVRLLALDHNAGVRARNLAVEQVDTPYVAFNDDDSWWAPGALDAVADLFDDHPTLGAVTAHIRVEPDGRDDPTSVEMAQSPVTGAPDVPGVPVLGFLACATAVRRDAFLDVGGFEEHFHFVGEEELLATDLAAAGWEVRYVPGLRVHHQPSTSRDHPWRQRRGVRNTLWYLWLRRPLPRAAARTWRLLRRTPLRVAVGGVADALRGGAWVARHREVVPADVERNLRLLDRQQRESEVRQYAT